MTRLSHEQPAKPTVFLSHCSRDRPQLLVLKRFLDERAGGLIEFFLSSDDESITPGTIWPAEVRAALDRMALMLIFVSPRALESGWTYFEAGYGLHKLKSANIYCLTGSDKASLPSPFNIIQNRNLHSAHDLQLLISHINSALGARISEKVASAEFQKLFKRTALGLVASGPTFEELVESVTVKVVGPANSIDEFARACRAAGEPFSTVAHASHENEERCSTGLRVAVEIPDVRSFDHEFKITDAIRAAGEAQVEVWGENWQKPGLWSSRSERRSLKELEAYNAKIRKRNEIIRNENARRLAKPRDCVFSLSNINFSVPVAIMDRWLANVAPKKPLTAEVTLQNEIQCEGKAEAISARVHGSELVLRKDGTLMWSKQIIVSLPMRGNRGVTLTAVKRGVTLEAFDIPTLVRVLFDLNILVLPIPRGTKRKR